MTRFVVTWWPEGSNNITPEPFETIIQARVFARAKLEEQIGMTVQIWDRGVEPAVTCELYPEGLNFG